MDSTDKERIYKEGVAADPVELDGDAEYTDLDAKQMIQRVGDSMYSSPKSAFRELYVNALSHGIMQRAKAENIDLLTYDEAADDFPHVEVNIDVANRKLTIHDIAGQGISRDDFTDITQFIGHSGNFDRERPGKWGMGIFSFLKLSSVLHAHIYSASTGESYQKISQDGVKWTMPRQDGQSGRKKTVSKIDAVGGYRCKCGHPHSDMANKCTHPVNRVRPEKGTCKCEKFEAEFIPVPADMKSAIEPDKPIQSGVKLTLVLKPEVKLTEMYRACKDIGTHWPVITRIQITEDIRKKQNVNKNSSIKGYGLSKGEDQEDVVQEACLERIGRHNIKDALWENVNSAEQSNINKDTISYVEKHIETDDFSLDVLVCRRPAASVAYGPSKKCPIFLLNVPIDVESYVRNAIPHEWIWHLNIKNEGNLSPTGDRDRLSEQACEILYDELRRVIGELFQDINDRLESHVIPASIEKFKRNKDSVEEERQIPENQNFGVAIKALNNDHLLVMNGDQSMETLTENGVVRTPLHEQYPDRLHQFHDAITQVCTVWLGNTNKEWKTKIGDVLTFPRVMSINNYSQRQIEGVTTYKAKDDHDWKPVTQWSGDKRGVDESYCAGDGIEEYRQDPNSIVFIRSPSHTASNQEYDSQQAHFDMCGMMRATDFVKQYDVYVAPEPIKPKEDSQSVESSSYKPAVPISGIINVHSFPSHSVLSGKKHTIYKPAKDDTENIVAEFNNRNTVLVYDCTRQDLFGEDCPEPGQLIRMDNIRRWSYGVAVMNPIAGASNISFIKGTKALRELLPNARTINQFFLDIGNEKVRVVRKDVSTPKIVEESDDTELPIPTPEEIIPDKYQLVDMTIKELMTTLPLITERDYTSIRTNGINYAVDYYRVACPDSSLYLKQLGLPEDVKCDINDVLANDIDWGTVEYNGRHDRAYNQSFYVKTQPDQEIQATVKRNGVQVSYLPHILAENTELIAYLSYYLSAWAMSEYRSTPHMTHDTNLINKAYSITRRGKQTPYNKLIRWWGTLDPRLRKSLTNDDEMVPFRNWHHVWGSSANSGDIAVTGVNLTGMIPRCIKSIADYDRFVETVQEQILKVFPFMTACHRNTSLPKLIGPLKQTPIRTLNNTFASMRNAGGEPMGHIIWKYLNVEGTRDFADTSYQDEKSRDILLSFMGYMEMHPTLTAEVRYRPEIGSMSTILQKLSVSLHSQGIVDGSSSYDTKFTPVRKAEKSGIVVDNKFSDDFQNIVGGGDHSNILTQYINLWNITDGLMKFDKEVFVNTVKPIIKGDANWKFACTTQKLNSVDKDKQWDQFLNGLVVTFDEVVNLVKNDVDVYSVQNPSDGQHKKPLAIVTNVGIKPHVFEVDQNGMDNMYDVSISFASNSEFGFGGSERRLWSIDHDKYVFKTLQWKSFHVVEGALVLTGQLQLPFYEGGVRHAGESLITDQEVMIE